MRLARAYCYERQTTGDRDRTCAIDASPVAELAVEVQSPTIRRANSGQGARVMSTRADHGERQDTCDCHRTAPIRGGPVAQLSFPVESPAVGGSGERNPACVVTGGTSADLGKGQATRDRDGASPTDRAPVAELAVGVQSPTVRHTRAGDAAGTVLAGVHGPEHEATADCHGTTGIRVRERPAAELAEVVCPP